MTDRPPPPPADPAADTGFWFALFTEIGILAQLSRAMLEARLPEGFVAAQFAVLDHLVRMRDGRTPVELARAFQVPKTSMTHSLAVLERAGLVRFAPTPGDGRSKQVWITGAGRRFRDDAIAALAPDFAALAARFPAGRLAAALPALAALRRELEAARDP